MKEPDLGDYFVVRTTGIAARLIQLGTWSKWNHAGIYIGNGQVVEARPTGVSVSPLFKYDNNQIIWNTGHDKPLTQVERKKLVEFALGFVGSGYGIWSIISLGFKCLTFGIPLLPADWMAIREKRVICSQLVAWVYSHAGVKLSNKKHALVRPKDLALRLSRK